MSHLLRLIPGLALLLSGACSEPRTSPKSGGHDASGKEETVRIVFSLPGDDIGSPESKAILEKIADSVAARGVGEVLGSGFGMGRMDLLVRPRGDDSFAALERIIREAYPAARYRIERGGS